MAEERRKLRRLSKESHPTTAASELEAAPYYCYTPHNINNLDDGCLMHIFSFLSPIPDRYNTALVCHRWRFLACHPRLWLRVDRSVRDLSLPGVFPNIETAVSSARLAAPQLKVFYSLEYMQNNLMSAWWLNAVQTWGHHSDCWWRKSSCIKYSD
nr:F-box protein SKIP5 [Ipomoea batatas]